MKSVEENVGGKIFKMFSVEYFYSQANGNYTNRRLNP